MISLSHLEPESPAGLVHLYVGDGKGKTTAAVGLAVRAAGQGCRVLFCQFLKGRSTGELSGLKTLGIQVSRPKASGKFLHQMTDEERRATEASHRLFLRELNGEVRRGRWDLVVLDEGVDADNCGLLEAGSLATLVKARGFTEVVLTGRNPSDSLRKLADYHTLFTCVCHPYQKGVAARRGIEY